MKYLNKKGTDNFTNFIIGIIVIVLLIASSSLLFGSAGFLNVDFLDGVPFWFVSMLTIGVGVAVVRLVVK